MDSVKQTGIFFIHAPADGAPMGTFPPEFRKKAFSGVDRRFTILFGVLVTVICSTILILSYIQLPKLSEEQVTKRIIRMQEKYLRMVEGAEAQKPQVETAKPTTVTQQESAVSTKEATEEVVVDRSKETFVDKQKRRDATTESRRQQRDKITKQISSAGIFAAITAGAGRGGSGGPGSGVGGGVSDLLGDADAVSSLDQISVAKGTFATRNVSAEELKARKATPVEQRGEVGIETQKVGRAAVAQVASAAAVVNITSETPEIKGDEAQVTTSKACIQRVITRESTRIKRVYEDWLKRDPALNGRVKIKFIIMTTGSVSNASVVQSTMNNPGFEQAVLRYIQRWDFSACPPASPLDIEFPFVFEGQS